MMRIILINGKKRSGKDYFANMLKCELQRQDKRVEIVSFAGPLKEIIATTFNITEDQLDQYKNSSEKVGIIIIDPNIKSFKTLTNFRHILQNFGTEAMKKHFGENVWSNLFISQLENKNCDFVIVPDFRFKCESDAVFSAYNSNYLFHKPITVRIKNSDVEKHGDQHRSETELDDYDFMYTIDNTGYPNIGLHVKSFTNSII